MPCCILTAIHIQCEEVDGNPNLCKHCQQKGELGCPPPVTVAQIRTSIENINVSFTTHSCSSSNLMLCSNYAYHSISHTRLSSTGLLLLKPMLYRNGPNILYWMLNRQRESPVQVLSAYLCPDCMPVEEMRPNIEFILVRKVTLRLSLRLSGKIIPCHPS